MKLNYPVDEHTISQPFCFDNTTHPQRKAFYSVFDNKHPGVDFPVSIGTKVYAAFAGIVVRNENHKGMGNVISIRNGNIVALYSHLNESVVKLGNIIEDGSLLGLSGNTGDACLTPHLHFELRNISKSELRNMVFEPIFDIDIFDYSDTFIYKVNNSHTSKNLSNLAMLFFGDSGYASKLKEFNRLNCDYFGVLPNGLELSIPNF